MKEMFLVVEPFFVQSKVSVVLGIKLSYVIKIYVLALKSSLHQQMPLAWKKEQFFLPATTVFIKCAREYFKR